MSQPARYVRPPLPPEYERKGTTSAVSTMASEKDVPSAVSTMASEVDGSPAASDPTKQYHQVTEDQLRDALVTSHSAQEEVRKELETTREELETTREELTQERSKLRIENRDYQDELKSTKQALEKTQRELLKAQDELETYKKKLTKLPFDEAQYELIIDELQKYKDGENKAKEQYEMERVKLKAIQSQTSEK